MTVRTIGEERSHVPTRTLGATATRVSAIALGTASWGPSFDDAAAREIVDAYLDAGGFTVEVTDAAEGASEAAVRQALVERQGRQDYVLVARSGRHSARRFAPGPDTSRSALMGALDASLARLGVEHVDLWLVDGDDGITPVDEVAATLDWAVQSGRATQVGVAGRPAWQVVDLSHHLARRNIALAADAQEHHLLRREIDAHVDAAAARGHGVIAGAGLAGGVLTGKYRHVTPADSRRAAGENPPGVRVTSTSRAIVESLATAADGLGVHPSELALAWQLHLDGIDSVLVGARTQSQLRIAVRAGQLSVPQEILDALDEVSRA